MAAAYSEYAQGFVNAFDNTGQLTQNQRDDLTRRVSEVLLHHGERYALWLRRIVEFKNYCQNLINRSYRGLLTIYIQTTVDVGFFVCPSANGRDTRRKHMHVYISYEGGFRLKHHLVSHVNGAYLQRRRESDYFTEPTEWFNILLDNSIRNNLGKKHSSKKHSSKKHSSKKHSNKKHSSKK